VNTIDDITQMEARLLEAELGPDPAFFEEALADDALLDGQFAKAKVVEAHRPEKGQKFTRVEMSDMRIIDHGVAAVVTCTGTYEGPNGVATLRFMRVWVKKPDGWQMVAGTTAHA
jgi:hypothetical protein